MSFEALDRKKKVHPRNDKFADMEIGKLIVATRKQRNSAVSYWWLRGGAISYRKIDENTFVIKRTR